MGGIRSKFLKGCCSHILASMDNCVNRSFRRISISVISSVIALLLVSGMVQVVVVVRSF